MGLTSKMLSPEPFRLWSAITAVAGVLERRVYTMTRGGATYPNMFVTLTGAAGSGKTQAESVVRNMWAGVSGLHLAPDNLTEAAFYDSLNDATRTSLNGSGATIFCAMCAACAELGVLIPAYDRGFLSLLSHIWDNPPHIHSRRRDMSRTVEIDKPTLSILACTTPNYLADMLPEVAWGQGFTSRMLFIYSFVDVSGDDIDMFSPPENLYNAGLVEALNEYFAMSGEIVWSEPARNEFNAWRQSGYPPVPDHGRLREYCSRRGVHVIKLAMISSISAGHDTVLLEDFERAQAWLVAAERTMPDVFRAMSQRSDQQLIADLHHHVYTHWQSTERAARKAVPQTMLYDFLSARVPSERIARIIEVAERSGVIRRGFYPDEWVPRPLNE